MPDYSNLLFKTLRSVCHKEVLSGRGVLTASQSGGRGLWEAPEVPLHRGANQGVAGSHPLWVVFVHIVKQKAISGTLCERQKERTKFTPKPHVVATCPLRGVSLGSQQACCGGGDQRAACEMPRCALGLSPTGGLGLVLWLPGVFLPTVMEL